MCRPYLCASARICPIFWLPVSPQGSKRNSLPPDSLKCGLRAMVDSCDRYLPSIVLHFSGTRIQNLSFGRLLWNCSVEPSQSSLVLGVAIYRAFSQSTHPISLDKVNIGGEGEEFKDRQAQNIFFQILEERISIPGLNLSQSMTQCHGNDRALWDKVDTELCQSRRKQS